MSLAGKSLPIFRLKAAGYNHITPLIYCNKTSEPLCHNKFDLLCTKWLAILLQWNQLTAFDIYDTPAINYNHALSRTKSLGRSVTMKAFCWWFEKIHYNKIIMVPALSQKWNSVAFYFLCRWKHQTRRNWTSDTNIASLSKNFVDSIFIRIHTHEKVSNFFPWLGLNLSRTFIDWFPPFP